MEIKNLNNLDIHEISKKLQQIALPEISFTKDLKEMKKFDYIKN